MTFSRANALGWNTNEVLTSTQANTMDLNQSRAVDGFAGGVYSPSAKLEWREGIEVDASFSASTNVIGIESKGKGTGVAGKFTGGASAVYAIQAFADAATNTGGGDFLARGTGIGVNISATASSGAAIAAAAGSGAVLTGTSNSGAGASVSVLGGTADCVTGSNAGTGAGVTGDTTTGTGYAVVASAKLATPTKAALRVIPQNADPSSLDDGATWIVGKDSFQQASGVTHQMNPVKAWANITTTGGGAATINSSYNVATATISGSNCRITFTDSFVDDGYSSVPQMNVGGADIVTAINQNATPSTYTDVSVYDDTGAQRNLSTTSTTFSIVICGELN